MRYYRDEIGDEVEKWVLWAAAAVLLAVLVAAVYDAACYPPTRRDQVAVAFDGQRPVTVVYYHYPYYHPWGWGLWYTPYPYYGGGGYRSYRTTVNHYHRERPLPLFGSLGEGRQPEAGPEVHLHEVQVDLLEGREELLQGPHVRFQVVRLPLGPHRRPALKGVLPC
jgi:hypothetical protein